MGTDGKCFAKAQTTVSVTEPQTATAPEESPEIAVDGDVAPTEGAPEAAADEQAEAAEAQTANDTPAEVPETGSPVEKTPERPTSVQLADLTKRTAIAERVERRSQALVEEAARRVRAAEEREAAIAARERELSEGDEFALLEKVARAKGVDLSTLVRRGLQRMANGGNLSPEEQAKVDEEKKAGDWRALQARVEAAEKKLKERDERDVASEQERQVTAWQSETIAAAQTLKEELPFVSDLPATEIGNRALNLTSQYLSAMRHRGIEVDESHLRSPEFRRQVLQEIEKQEKARVESEADLLTTRLRRLGKLPTVAEAVSSVPGSSKTGAQDSGPAKAARTLTNNGAAQRSTNGVSRQLTDRELIEYAAQAIPDFQ